MIWYLQYERAIELIESRRQEAEHARLVQASIDGRSPGQSLPSRVAQVIGRSLGRGAIRAAVAIDPSLAEPALRQPDRPRPVRI